jgi:hypothetical protein
MGFGTWIASVWGTGQTPDELAAESARLDAALAEDQERKRKRDQDYLLFLREEGFDTVDQQVALNERVSLEREHLDTQRADTEDIRESLDRAYDAGQAEGAANVSGFFGGIVKLVTDGAGAVLKGALGGIPIWLWLLGAVALFVYLGGGNFVRAKITKHLTP